MKKLTAGIFATLLAVVSADSAYAAIASQGYVDDKVEAVETTVATKADSSTVTALGERVTTAEGEIDTLQSTVAGKADKATTLSGYGITDAYTSADGTELEERVSAVEAPKAQVAANVTGPVSGGTVYTAIQGVSGDVSGVTSDVATLKSDMTEAKADISALETASANHVVKNEAITGGTHTKITYDAKGLVTAGADLTADDIPTIPNTKVSGLGSLAKKSSVATADIASKAVTKEKLADEIVTSLGKADTALQQASLNGYVTKAAADAAYADIATETTANTASTNAQAALENIGTLTNLTTNAKNNTVVAINEVASEAAAAASAASAADGKAVAAQGAVDTLEETVTAQGTRLTTAEGDIDTIQGQISNMATSETVTNLTNRVTTAEGDITALETAVNDAESGLVATNAIADEALANAATAQSAAEAAQNAADSKLPTATYNTQVGSVSATNMGTTATTVVAAIKEVAGEAAAAQNTANSANTAAGAAQDAAEAAQQTANAAIPAPTAACADPDNKCVLVSSGAGNYSWEVIARGDAE